ncbi:MAG: alkaline phosphatase, partial [Kiritimatiellaceae bacterium]|nr:alkaline phosphatase [Kiritimatiellaceae bacterium]
MNDRIKTKWILLTLWCAGLSLTYGAEPVKNIIFMIGDGMGYEQVRATVMYNGTPLYFETFPYIGQQTTLSDGGAVTDSAAGGTALATGVTVVNNVLSMRIPGDKSRLETILEYIQKRGRRTGLVTTVPTPHATPAAFGAHVTNRTNTTAIAYEYLNISRPNVLLGGGRDGMTPASAIAAGYTVVTNVSGLLAVNPNTIEFLSGQFIAPDGSGYSPYEATGIGSWPHLSQMTATALDLLDNDPDGFFLMVEGGKIDYAGHASQLPHLIGEVLEFHNAVAVVTNWAAGRTDTLILVTADHETGGLSVQADNGAGNLPTVSWGGGGQHTASNVP